MDARSEGPPFFFPDVYPLPNVGKPIWRAGYGSLTATGSTPTKATQALSKLLATPEPVTVVVQVPRLAPQLTPRRIVIGPARPGSLPATMKREIASMTGPKRKSWRNMSAMAKHGAMAPGYQRVRETGEYKRIGPVMMV